MDSSAFDRLRSDFIKEGGKQTGAVLTSVGAVLTYVLLLLLLYLFVDLLAWKGEVPSFAQLSAAQKQQFWGEWQARPEADRKAAVARLGLSGEAARRVESAEELKTAPTAGEWQLRWRAGVYLSLKERVHDRAADAYLPETGAEERPQLGLLSLVARERSRWTGAVLGKVAAGNSWTWSAGESGANLRYLTGLTIIALVLAAVRGVVSNVSAYLAARTTLLATEQLRKAVYTHTYRLGSMATQPDGAAEAVGVFTKQVDRVADAMHAHMTATFRHPLKILLLVVLIMLINFWLAVSFLLLALLVWVIGGQLSAHFRRESRIGSKQAEGQLHLLREGMGLLRLVKGYQMERFNQTRMQRQLAESGRGWWRKSRGDALAQPLLAAVALIAAVALAYLAARAVLAGELSVAGLVVMAVAVVSLGPPIVGWVSSRLRIRRGREAADAIIEYFDRRDDALEAANAEYVDVITTNLQFRGVSVKDPGTGRLLLDDVSFAVPAHTRVAIVGADPAEKRAVMHLLLRFLDPTGGEIRINDKNIKYVTYESLRGHVAAVMQDDLTYSDTVLNNIGCGDPANTLPKVIEAAKLAHAHQFIEKLPHGYETVVGELGVSLTLGERFRVALARALLRTQGLLIIEEPSGAIDEDTLALFDDTLARLGPAVTIIFLANRASTLRAVKRVFFLRKGKLEDDGSHVDLWRGNEHYRRLRIVADAGEGSMSGG